MTKIEIADDEAKNFLFFREHQQELEALIKAGIFNVRGGQAVLNFNKDGVLMNIKIEMITWHKTKSDDNLMS